MADRHAGDGIGYYIRVLTVPGDDRCEAGGWRLGERKCTAVKAVFRRLHTGEDTL
jgi:hypothetical protein